MEGTENLDDEVFNKRHQRLEVDERRRKRWDDFSWMFVLQISQWR